MSESGNKVVLSGVQPTGDLHIGNYLGAIKKFVKIQSDFDSIIAVVSPITGIDYNSDGTLKDLLIPTL